MAHNQTPRAPLHPETLGTGKSWKAEMGEGGAYPGSGGKNLQLTTEYAGKQPTSAPKAVVRKKGIWSTTTTSVVVDQTSSVRTTTTLLV